MLTGTVASGEGKLRGSLPKVNSTRLSMMMPSATVAISQAFEPRRTKGRTAKRSMAMPATAHSSSDAAMAAAIGQPCVTAKV